MKDRTRLSKACELIAEEIKKGWEFKQKESEEKITFHFKDGKEGFGFYFEK